MIAAATWLLAGCSTIDAMNPVNWWHKQQGGKIAEQRPAPPGAEQPYPNLSTVPGKPAAPDQEALKKLTASLVADRTNAQHAAQSAPLPDPSSPSASPALFGVGSAPPPRSQASGGQASGGQASGGQVDAASASLPAVTAPPVPATPPPVAAAPSPAPRPKVTAAPLANAPAASASAATAPAATAAAAPSASAMAGSPPDLPAGPPPRPAAAGVAPAVSSPPPQPMPTAGTKAADIVFVENSTTLSAAASDEVKAFAAQRGNAVIGVTGYGEASASDPAAQLSALNLGLARAQSIAEALKADGVPGTAIRVSAEASGRGASLHLLQ